MLSTLWIPSLLLALFVQDPKDEFTVEVQHDRLPVISQGSTGTCWAFATTSFLESEIERLHGKTVDLSEIHTVFFAYEMKLQRYIDAKGEAQFGQGGLAHDVMAIVAEHGVVPNELYDGLCGQRRHNHGQMERVLKAMADVAAKSRRPDERFLAAYRAVLSSYLGAPPDQVAVGDRVFTPREYAIENLAIPTGAYRTLMSYRSKPYWEEQELVVPDNWMHYAGYGNVPLDALFANMDHALKNGFTVAIDVDVSERGASHSRGKFQLEEDLENAGAITEELRQEMFDDKRTTDDHLMHVVGMAKDANGGRWYLTKDSNGQYGPFKGYVYISRNYIAAKVLSFMVHEDGLLPETRTKLGWKK
ncbi:MAG: aminopeptidase [Planctomycetes bacterium]|nr:aminopeptidase [Planctomycetota bacterium]MCB9891932.1 aminopeptidase [Planctomycetota bacterium]